MTTEAPGTGHDPATPAAREPVLQVIDADLGYGELQVVFGVSLHVGEGELVALVGGNGSGKSTILRAVSGMIRPWRGRIVLRGEDVGGLTPHELALRGLAHVPMGRQLFPDMTVEENLSLGAYLPPARARRPEGFERVYGLFPDLYAKRKAPAGALSGGQQQMLAIGRALMARPKLLMLDEPSLGLAPLLVRAIFETVQAINEQGVTVLLVEQNARAALRLADYGYVLETGTIALEGPAAELLDNERVRHAYLGEG